jgi:hypothetical protein
MTFAEEKLLFEAEAAATKCLLCFLYGHKASGCPTLSEHLLPHETKLQGRTYSIQVRGWRWRWALWLALVGFGMGVVAVEIWKGMN